MSMNILNDISAVYLNQVAESAVPGKPAERLGAVTDIPKDEQEAARERLLAKAKAKRAKKVEEALDPVGQEDSDIDNDGDTDSSDKYLHKRRKAIGKAIKKEKMKESFSNWRQDLREIVDEIETNKEIKEKKVNNKVTINPDFKESVEEIGGTLLEMVEIDEIDYIVESVYGELLDEGYCEDDIEEALEYALTEAKVTFGHDTESPRDKMMKRAKGRLKFLGRKVGEKIGAAKKSAQHQVAKAQVSAYNKGREVAQTASDKVRKVKQSASDAGRKVTQTASNVKTSVSNAPQRAKSGVKSFVKRQAQKVVNRMSEETLNEKAESEQQQKLFGLALSVKRGQTSRSEVSDAVLKIVDSMSEKKIRDFAKTKHEGLPKKVEEQMDEPMNSDPQQGKIQKNIQKQKVKELTTRLQAARKGVY